ncbi:MAG: integrase arm-type DNA-binding domain-containing protein [Rudaea sp.]|nr:integrase arm-type DNA-binding domain-containing protein [Rudaea sp.]
MPKLAKPLSETQVRNAKARDKTYKLFDGGGLYVEVPTVGSKRWRFKYSFEGREKLLSFGTYPDVSLSDARENRDDARKLVRNGQDPSALRKAAKPQAIASRTFQSIAEEWLEKKRLSWSEKHVKKVRTSLERDAFPAIGSRDVATIQIADMLDVLRKVEARGALDVAARIGQRCASVFKFAKQTGRCSVNPASELSGVVKQRKVVHRAALSRADIPEFLRNLESYDGIRSETRIGLRLLMLTFVRTGELRGALWSEINFDDAEWRIPAERMKMGDAHVVPLARQTIDALKELQTYTSWSQFLLPNDDGLKPISENTMLFALYRMGYHGRATGHGFRALASTCLNEMGWNPDVIERQLAHLERNKVRAAYNRATYLVERRKMMQAWADFIDTQRERNVSSNQRAPSGNKRHVAAV